MHVGWKPRRPNTQRNYGVMYILFRLTRIRDLVSSVLPRATGIETSPSWVPTSWGHVSCAPVGRLMFLLTRYLSNVHVSVSGTKWVEKGIALSLMSQRSPARPWGTSDGPHRIPTPKREMGLLRHADRRAFCGQHRDLTRHDTSDERRRSRQQRASSASQCRVNALQSSQPLVIIAT